MPYLFAAILLAALTLSSCQVSPAGGTDHRGHLRHCVLFKFKDDTPPEKIQAIEAAFARLPSQIPSIIGFEWGTDVGVEGLDNGFTHCFLVTFADAAGREVYLPHPAHKAFVELAKPSFDKVQVIDYIAR